MLLVRCICFVVVLALVLGAALAVQDQEVLVPGGDRIMAMVDHGAMAEAQPASCTYLGVRGLEQAPSAGRGCPWLRDPDWRFAAFVSQAQAGPRERGRGWGD